MSTRLRSIVASQMPWSAGVAWWVVGLEGLLLIGLGLALVFQTDATGDVARVLIALALIVLGVQQVMAARAPRRTTFWPWQIVGGVIGVAVGLLVALNPMLHFIGADPARIVLGLGLFLVGAVTLTGVLFSPTVEVVPLESVFGGALAIGAGMVVLSGEGSGGAHLLGWIAVIGGLGILLYALLLVRGQLEPGRR